MPIARKAIGIGQVGEFQIRQELSLNRRNVGIRDVGRTSSANRRS